MYIDWFAQKLLNLQNRAYIYGIFIYILLVIAAISNYLARLKHHGRQIGHLTDTFWGPVTLIQ